MKIKPCTEDVVSDLSIWIVIVLCELFVLLFSRWNQIVIWGILAMNGVLIGCSVRDIVYFARTINLNCEGCVFSLWGFERRYQWSDVDIHLCREKDFQYSDSEVRGPGLLICPKSAKYSSRMSAMTYCRYFHPFSSVYLRFRSSKDIQPIITGKIVYYGYIVEEKAIVDFLVTCGIQLHK